MNHVSGVATVAIRWSDLDVLGHVNNVSYLALAEQSWEGLHADIWPMTSVRHIDIQFSRPATYEAAELCVSASISPDQVVQTLSTNDGRTVATVTSYRSHKLADRSFEADVEDRYALRPNDYSSRGQLHATSLMLALQESRIRFSDRLFGASTKRRFAVASIGFDLAQFSESASSEVLQMSTVPVRLGRKSLTLRTRIVGASSTPIFAECVVVAFDAEKQISRELSEEERAILSSLIA